MKVRLARFAVATSLVLSLGALAGCRFGEARFEGDLDGRPFDPGGTVFAYVDARDDSLVEELRPRVAIVMTWLAFDPTADLNDLPGATLEDYRHELALRDALALVFDDQGELEDDALFESVVEGGQEVGDGRMSARLHLAPERLDGNSGYADFTPFASRRKIDVIFEEVRFADARHLTGHVRVEIERTEDDPGDARIGTIEGTFRAPLVDERTAEQNLALLAVDDLLGVPLPPRPEPVEQ